MNATIHNVTQFAALLKAASSLGDDAILTATPLGFTLLVHSPNQAALYHVDIPASADSIIAGYAYTSPNRCEHLLLSLPPLANLLFLATERDSAELRMELNSGPHVGDHHVHLRLLRGMAGLDITITLDAPTAVEDVGYALPERGASASNATVDRRDFFAGLHSLPCVAVSARVQVHGARGVSLAVQGPGVSADMRFPTLGLNDGVQVEPGKGAVDEAADARGCFAPSLLLLMPHAACMPAELSIGLTDGMPLVVEHLVPAPMRVCYFVAPLEFPEESVGDSSEDAEEAGESASEAEGSEPV